MYLHQFLQIHYTASGFTRIIIKLHPTASQQIHYMFFYIQIQVIRILRSLNDTDGVFCRYSTDVLSLPTISIQKETKRVGLPTIYLQ